MIKLQEIIPKLESNTYESIEAKLVKTKAENFLFLLRSFRNKNIKEEQIMKELGLTTNSFYTLKSRLYDKIQEELTQDITPGKKEIYQQLEQIHEVCYSKPYDVAVCYLLKLEKDLHAYDMYAELLQVYGALKKLHYNTGSYFHYSQLHNKHIAFWLSIEKAEDLLSNFNHLLEQYDLTRSTGLIDQLLFIRDEINTHLELNPSIYIELIKNIIDFQFEFFCAEESEPYLKTEKNLETAFEKIKRLPDSSSQQRWETALNFMAFGFYDRFKQTTKAQEYFEKIRNDISLLSLYSNVAIVSRFLIQSVAYYKTEKKENITNEIEKISHNKENMYCAINISLFKALYFFHNGQKRKSIGILNELLNNYSFKDYFHIHMKIKFNLAFYYLTSGEIDLAEALVDSVYKKIKANNLENYSNTLHLIKFFRHSFKGNQTNRNKQEEELLLFIARNKGREEMLSYLIPVLNDYIKNEK